MKLKPNRDMDWDETWFSLETQFRNGGWHVLGTHTTEAAAKQDEADWRVFYKTRSRRSAIFRIVRVITTREIIGDSERGRPGSAVNSPCMDEGFASHNASLVETSRGLRWKCRKCGKVLE